MTVASPGAVELPYRPSVGMMVFNRFGLVWVGRRLPKWAERGAAPFWQMPQGGIEPNETPETAALRELTEETGAPRSSLAISGAISEWLVYDLPPNLVGIALKGRYRGQRQRWFAIRFAGPDSQFDIRGKNRGKAEFDAWKWATPNEVLAEIVPFKRALYEDVLREFAPLLTSTSRPFADPLACDDVQR